MYNLPNFVTFPPAPPTYKIEDDGVNFYVDAPEGKKLFDLPSQAADYIREKLSAEYSFDYRGVARASEDPAEEWLDGGFLFERDTNRLLLSFTQADRIKDLEEEHKNFLEVLTPQYEAEPDNWFVAYKWVERHPAFYHRYESYEDRWEFDQGWADCPQSVFLDDDGNPRVLLEHGPYLESERTQHSIDLNLVASGSNFEEAIVNLAKKVKQYYDENGADRS